MRSDGSGPSFRRAVILQRPNRVGDVTETAPDLIRASEVRRSMFGF
jgi:hypothetical protein